MMDISSLADQYASNNIKNIKNKGAPSEATSQKNR